MNDLKSKSIQITNAHLFNGTIGLKLLSDSRFSCVVTLGMEGEAEDRGREGTRPVCNMLFIYHDLTQYCMSIAQYHRGHALQMAIEASVKVAISQTSAQLEILHKHIHNI